MVVHITIPSIEDNLEEWWIRSCKDVLKTSRKSFDSLAIIPIHSMMALDLPPRTIAALAKICHGFLWCGKREANGGNCAVAWEMVCRSRWAGGLDIPNLAWLNKALQARWPWMQRADKTNPWSEFATTVPAESMALFHVAARAMIGNGKQTLFWEDRWINGFRICELAPGI